jgi:hypothetical protein
MIDMGDNGNVSDFVISSHRGHRSSLGYTFSGSDRNR